MDTGGGVGPSVAMEGWGCCRGFTVGPKRLAWIGERYTYLRNKQQHHQQQQRQQQPRGTRTLLSSLPLMLDHSRNLCTAFWTHGGVNNNPCAPEEETTKQRWLTFDTKPCRSRTLSFPCPGSSPSPYLYRRALWHRQTWHRRRPLAAASATSLPSAGGREQGETVPNERNKRSVSTRTLCPQGQDGRAIYKRWVIHRFGESYRASL